MIIPIVNIVLVIIIYNQLSLSFGKDAGFTLGLSFIFFPIPAFGDALYIGPGGINAYLIFILSSWYSFLKNNI